MEHIPSGKNGGDDVWLSARCATRKEPQALYVSRRKELYPTQKSALQQDSELEGNVWSSEELTGVKSGRR
jgi:hypothetical protein